MSIKAVKYTLGKVTKMRNGLLYGTSLQRVAFTAFILNHMNNMKNELVSVSNATHHRSPYQTLPCALLAETSEVTLRVGRSPLTVEGCTAPDQRFGRPRAGPLLVYALLGRRLGLQRAANRLDEIGAD